MLQLQRIGEKYIIYYDDHYMGSLQLYDNSHHMRNCYVKLDMKFIDTNISTELFKQIKDTVNRKLQVMVNASDEATIAFLTAGGFVCKRRCYEVDASGDAYIGGKGNVQLFYTYARGAVYERCCRMMFDYYVKTHRAVNPWTADYEAFCQSMPAKVVFARQDEEIVALAFIEDNEIAYVCGVDKAYFVRFARALVTSVLAEYKTVSFEADDCDWAAMILKSLFINQDDVSFDTYILGDI